MNKKGFTLAELLIVIAIIAVLIAIAIPTFSGALRNARLQTDHANIRNAYAMMMVAEMQGFIEADGSTVTINSSTTNTDFVFQKDGTLKSTGTMDNYLLQATANEGSATGECNASAGCKGNTHTKDMKIIIRYTAASGSNPASWALKLEA